MKPCHLLLILLSGFAVSGFVVGCTTAPQAPTGPQSPAMFQRVLPLLETNCIHCHGDQRLPSMPSFADTKALAGLIGPGKLIVPGQPESSRVFQVVTFSDQQTGAMPPTGHAIAKPEVESLRAWIQSGAPLPADHLALKPRGTGIRSR